MRASVLLLALACGSTSGAARTAPAPDGSSFTWLLGTWTQGEVSETWRREGERLVAVGRMGDRIVEHIVLAPVAGVWTYTASPEGQATTSFPLVELGERAATFELPEHDDPQRIRYRRTHDSLEVTVEQIDGTRSRSWSLVSAPN